MQVPNHPPIVMDLDPWQDDTRLMVPQTMRPIQQQSMLVLHQAMDSEWNSPGEDRQPQLPGHAKAWGYQSARRMAALGYVVLRIRTLHWTKVKQMPYSSHRYRQPKVFSAQQQQMICTINYRDVVAPTMEYLRHIWPRIQGPPPTWMHQIRSIATADLEHARTNILSTQGHAEGSKAGLEASPATLAFPAYIYCETLQQLAEVQILTPHQIWDWNQANAMQRLAPVDWTTPTLEVVAVTEASSLMSEAATPQIATHVFNTYSEDLIWAGFNSKGQHTGSKLLLGSAQSVVELGRVFQQLLVTHIDQQYKGFICEYFRKTSPSHILAGVCDHKSSCNNNLPEGAMPNTAIDYMPDLKSDNVYTEPTKAKPRSDRQPFTPEAFILSAISNTKRIMDGDKGEVVGSRMLTYIPQDSYLRHDRRFRELAKALSDELHAKQVAKIAANVLDQQRAVTEVTPDLDRALAGEVIADAENTFGVDLKDPQLQALQRHGWITAAFTLAHYRAATDMGMTVKETPTGIQVGCKWHTIAPSCPSHMEAHLTSNRHSQQPGYYDRLRTYQQQYGKTANDKTEDVQFNIISQMFGMGAVLIQCHSQWKRGQALGKSRLGPTCFTLHGMLSPVQTPELWESRMGALASLENFQRRRQTIEVEAGTLDYAKWTGERNIHQGQTEDANVACIITWIEQDKPRQWQVKRDQVEVDTLLFEDRYAATSWVQCAGDMHSGGHSGMCNNFNKHSHQAVRRLYPRLQQTSREWCTNPQCAQWHDTTTRAPGFACHECNQWICSDCVWLFVPLPSNTAVHHRCHLPHSAVQTEHQVKIRFNDPTIEQNHPVEPEPSKRTWHDVSYVVPPLPTKEPRQLQNSPKAPDVYPPLTGPYQPDSQWQTERQAHGEPSTMGVTIPATYPPHEQLKEQPKYVYRDKQTASFGTTSDRQRRYDGWQSDDQTAPEQAPAKKAKWADDEWHEWTTQGDNPKRQEPTEDPTKRDKGLKGEDQSDDKFRQDEVDWGDDTQEQDEQPDKPDTVEPEQTPAAGASSSSQATPMQQAQWKPLLQNDVGGVPPPQCLEIIEIVEALLSASSIQSTRPDLQDFWPPEAVSAVQRQLLPPFITEGLEATMDTYTGKTNWEMWVDNWTTLLAFPLHQWRYEQYKPDAAKRASSNWIAFVKAYNYMPRGLPVTLAITLRCTQALLHLNVEPTVQPKIITAGRVRLLENQIRYRPQGRGLTKPVFKQPTNKQRQQPDRAAKLLSRASSSWEGKHE